MMKESGAAAGAAWKVGERSAEKVASLAGLRGQPV